jgi:hypothetical protein
MVDGDGSEIWRVLLPSPDKSGAGTNYTGVRGIAGRAGEKPDRPCAVLTGFHLARPSRDAQSALRLEHQDALEVAKRVLHVRTIVRHSYSSDDRRPLAPKLSRFAYFLAPLPPAKSRFVPYHAYCDGVIGAAPINLADIREHVRLPPQTKELCRK